MPKVLLVENNEMNREILSQRQEKRGFQIAMAVDGWEASRTPKAAGATVTISVIGVTARPMAGDREKCLEAGCDDFGAKPVGLPGPLERIGVQLQKKSSA